MRHAQGNGINTYKDGMITILFLIQLLHIFQDILSNTPLPNMSDQRTLSHLQGAGDEEKRIKPEDRQALSETLLDQVTIEQLDQAGKSSQEKRKESRRVRDAQQRQQSSASRMSTIRFLWV